MRVLLASSGGIEEVTVLGGLNLIPLAEVRVDSSPSALDDE